MADYITWDEFNKKQDKFYTLSNYQITNILCPECGKPLFKHLGAVLTSHPIMYRYDCKECGWSGTR